ncbi:MAG: nicotinate phosphoribosyltransferase, partial [Microbacteriaceae bacterium]
KDATGRASAEVIHVGEPEAVTADHRPLLVALMTDGVADPRYLGATGTALARQHRAMAVAELPASALRLSRGEPALPTSYQY